MQLISYIMLFFSILGAIDRMLGNKFGIGKEFERGFQFLGVMALSMIGMIVISPLIAEMLSPLSLIVWKYLRIDPSVIPAMLFANDMGGAQLAIEVAKNEQLGRFQAMVVSSMMGATISFSVPCAIGIVEERQHRWLMLGLLCGFVTIPIGCLCAGVLQKLSFGLLYLNLLPLQIFSIIISIGLFKFPNICVKICNILAVGMKCVITLGLALGLIRFVTGFEVIRGLSTIEEGMDICLNACVVMSGAFPLLLILSKVLSKPLSLLSKIMGINEASAIGFLTTLGTNVTTFGNMNMMDDKGVLLNSAFAVSAAFVFAGHLAFTMAFDGEYLGAVIIGKLIAGVLAIILAGQVYKVIRKTKMRT